MSRLKIVPQNIKRANFTVREWHRHHKPVQGALFAVGLAFEGQLVGCAIIGRPVSRMLDDGVTTEVTRLCVRDEEAWKDFVKNGCSMLYSAARRASKCLGYSRTITYTLESESGASLIAAGWKCLGPAGGGSWSRPSRPRETDHPIEGKLIWEAP